MASESAERCQQRRDGFLENLQRELKVALGRFDATILVVAQIPDGVDLKKYQSVVIWCEQFGVLISPADLMVASR